MISEVIQTLQTMKSDLGFNSVSCVHLRFEKDIEDMIGHRPHWYWKIMWVAVCPVLLIALFVFYIINYIKGGAPTYQAWDKELVRHYNSANNRTETNA